MVRLRKHFFQFFAINSGKDGNITQLMLRDYLIFDFLPETKEIIEKYFLVLTKPGFHKIHYNYRMRCQKSESTTDSKILSEVLSDWLLIIYWIVQ